MGNTAVRTINYNDEIHLGKYNNRSRGEKVCRLILESLFEKSFSSSYPSFLSYSDKKDGKKTKLEIDLFNEDLNFGLEYQGKQHYLYVKYFHHTIEAFERSLKRDDFKRKMCHKNGIFLLEVPYFVKENELCMYIWDRIPQKIKDSVSKEKILKLSKNQLIVK